ncbi:MAG: aminotransferase, partial [Bacteroidia bacterium]
MTSLPPYSIHEKHWNHDKNIAFLNHGSFGSCPKAILDLQTQIKHRTEQDPIQELVTDFEPRYMENKNALAQFVGCNANDLVLMKNTTSGA